MLHLLSVCPVVSCIYIKAPANDFWFFVKFGGTSSIVNK